MKNTLKPKSSFLKFILVFIFSFSFLQQAVAEPSAPEYLRTKNWKIEKVSGTILELTAEVVFYNPNKVKAKLRDLDLDIFLNEKFLGKVIQDNMVKIPGKSSFDIPIRFKFDLSKSELGLSSLLGLLSNNKFIVDMKGFLKANVFALPFKIKLDERQEFSAKDFF